MSHLLINNQENILLNKAGENIYLRNYKKGKSPKTTILGNSQYDDYNGCIDTNGRLHIIYKNNNNALIYLSGTEDNFKTQHLLEDSSNKYKISHLNIISREQIYLFYSAVNPINKGYDLVFHRISNDSVPPKPLLTLPTEIPKYITLVHNNSLHLLFLIKDDHAYYLNCYVYDIPSDKWLGYDTIITSKTPIVDYSFCMINNELHLCYVVENYGHMTLYYSCFNEKTIELNNYDATSSSAHKITSSGSKIKCNIFAYHSTLWIEYIHQNTLYCCYSSDKGATISDPIKCTLQGDQLIDLTLQTHNKILSGHEFFATLSNKLSIAVLSQIDVSNLIYNSPTNHELNGLMINTTHHTSQPKDSDYIKKLEYEITSLKEQQKNIICQYDELRDFAKKLQDEGKKWRKKYTTSNKAVKSDTPSSPVTTNSNEPLEPMKKIIIDSTETISDPPTEVETVTPQAINEE